jgi:hypothetical protein
VLTQEGVGLREKVEREFMALMPWRALDQQERTCLLSLIRKMVVAQPGKPAAPGAAAGAAAPASDTPTSTPPSTGGEGAGEVSDTLITAQRAG